MPVQVWFSLQLTKSTTALAVVYCSVWLYCLPYVWQTGEPKSFLLEKDPEKNFASNIHWAEIETW